VVNPEVFKPGAPAIIEIRGYPKIRFQTFFRGCKYNHFLIIDHPIRDGRPVPIGDDTQCIIRFISEGEIIGFRSVITALIRNPEALAFLRYPKSVEVSRLRQSDRYPVQIEAVCAPKKLAGHIDAYPRAMMLNLSEGGCLLESIESFDKGELVYLTVFIPERPPVIDLESEIKRVDKKGDKFHLGMAFTDLLDPNFEEIQGYLHLLKSYRVRA
jgi:c-di-GMP-binding flagellar brake protein YcgR